MNEKIVKAFNAQINEELYSAYIYFAMAAYAEYNNLPGFANWLKIQAQEERDHAMGFYNYLASHKVLVELEAINKPTVTATGVMDILEKALAHEKHITGKINELVALATTEQDNDAVEFLKWYVEEQKEEEESFTELINKLKAVGDDVKTLDQELAQRTYHISSILVK